MAKQKRTPAILKLVLCSLIVGLLVGLLELYIGHRFILDPLLYEKDLNFIYESYFAPTYYGFTKSVIVSIVFFLTYLILPKAKFKPAIVGIFGTIILGLYYYFTFPRSTLYSSAIIGLVHFSFIAGITYIFSKIFKL